jgi:hypothetical protein
MCYSYAKFVGVNFPFKVSLFPHQIFMAARDHYTLSLALNIVPWFPTQELLGLFLLIHMRRTFLRIRTIPMGLLQAMWDQKIAELLTQRNRSECILFSCWCEKQVPCYFLVL